MSNPSQYQQYYSSEHRILRVRFLMLLAVLFWLVMQFASATLLPSLTSGVEPNGEAISAVEVVALIVIAQGVGWGALLGVHLYGRCYVVAKYRPKEAAGHHIYETLGWVNRIHYYVDPMSDASVRFHEGRIEGVYDAKSGINLMTVDAPYCSETLSGKRLPFIVDAAGFYFGDSH